MRVRGLCRQAYFSSDALVRDKYAVQAIPTVDTKGYISISNA
jgi:hypothetical protein